MKRRGRAKRSTGGSIGLYLVLFLLPLMLPHVESFENSPPLWITLLIYYEHIADLMKERISTSSRRILIILLLWIILNWKPILICVASLLAIFFRRRCSPQVSPATR